MARHNGGQRAVLERREVTEDRPPTHGREEKGHQDDPPVENERHMEHRRKPHRSAQGQDDTDEAAEGGESNSQLMEACWRSLNSL